jgi:hypothetical protein
MDLEGDGMRFPDDTQPKIKGFAVWPATPMQSTTLRVLGLFLALSSCLWLYQIHSWPPHYRALLPLHDQPVQANLTPSFNYSWRRRRFETGTDASPLAPPACLRRKWIYVIGDSSARFWFYHLGFLVHRTFGNQSKFGAYFALYPEHGGIAEGVLPEVCWNGQDKGCGCTRELFDYENGVRLTFSWKTASDENGNVQGLLDQLVSRLDPSNQPDLFVVATGAWDVLHGRDTDHAAGAAWSFLHRLHDTYASSLVAAVTINSCLPHRSSSVAWNERFLRSSNAERPRLAVYDRQSGTADLGPEDCDGYHVLDERQNMRQVQSVLQEACGGPP